ncbi:MULTISPECIES: DUF3164 family protein [unclassified Maridesulfovibrio]|uniref:DUF3164 family protein n=1 Tax=unclassified Maridesulfovibrio TaxID=2794999 RepID=UPI003B3F1116
MEGYMENAQGHQVPLDQVKEIDKLRHETVMELVGQVHNERKVMSRLKGRMMGDIEAFVQTSLEEYGVKRGGKKGNVTLHSFDGKYKIERAMQEHMVFDERLEAAETLIGECLQEWSEGSPGELKAVINDAFKVDSEGRVKVGRILGLRRLKINDERWNEAIRAINDSLQIVGSKSYVRVYERQEDGSYEALSLNMASIPLGLDEEE